MSDEKEKQAEVEPEKEDVGEEAPKQNPKNGKPKDKIDEAREVVEEMKKENARREELLKKETELEAKRVFSGQAEAGAVAEKPARLTDTEYAEALERGEVNPLAEDGLI